MDFQDKKIQKKVWICEREYNISMLSSEENSFDAVVKVIQDKVLELRTKFPKSDEQDILVMTLIQLVTKNISGEADDVGGLEIQGRLEAILAAIEDTINDSATPSIN